MTGPLDSDEEKMIAGSEQLRDAILIARTGEDPHTSELIEWRHTRNNDHSLKVEASLRRVREKLAAKERLAESRRVNREPCPRCGTRKDIGCKCR